MPSDIDLLELHAPIVRFNEGEYFLPAAVEAFLARAELWQRTGPTERTCAVPAGALDLDSLVERTRGHVAAHYLRLVSTPTSHAERVAWRLRGDRPRFRAETRLGRVGITARLIDLAGRMSLLLRGRVPAGDETVAALLSRDRPDAADHPYYGRVVHTAGFVVLQYWYFYFFNDWRTRAHGLNDHEGDWEQVTIFLAPREHGELQPRWVAFSSHDAAGVDLRRRWDDPDLTVLDGHPVVHAGLGSHAGGFLAGEYVTNVRGTRLRGLARVLGRVRRLLLPWERDRNIEGMGIPYVDYKRGDGVSIGVGAQRPWRPVLIDDDTPWIREYSGLWGNDTEDRFGGERGPAGPRYQRNGTVRESWSNPVGWAALDAVAPDEETRQAAVAARTEELAGELAAIDTERRVLRDRLRAAVLGGATDTIAEQRQLDALAARATVRGDELHRLREVAGGDRGAVHPHAHLRVRPMPLPTEPPGRRRFLRVWATISTPLLLVLIAVVIESSGRRLDYLALALILVMLTLEAIARGRLAAFLLTVVVVAVAGFAAFVVVGSLLASWQFTLVVLLLAAAVACLVANLKEVIRT